MCEFKSQYNLSIIMIKIQSHMALMKNQKNFQIHLELKRQRKIFHH